MAGKSPTALTLAYLRAEGWPLVEVVEHWNPFAHIRVDLFGIFDILAADDKATIGVQCTTVTNMSARRRKIEASAAAAEWVKCPGRRIWLIGWKQVGVLRKDGTKSVRKRWEPRIEVIA